LGEWQGRPSLPPVPLPRAEAGWLVRVKDTEQVHLCVGGEGVSLGDPQLYPLLCLTNLMGGGSSSRLFQEIRE